MPDVSCVECYNLVEVPLEYNGCGPLCRRCYREVARHHAYAAALSRIAQLEAELAELKSAAGPLIPPWFHESVPPSREICSSFVSGGFVTRYTVEQAKRAQKAMEPHD